MWRKLFIIILYVLHRKRIKKRVRGKSYEFGFVTDIEAEKAPVGLNEEIISLFLQKKMNQIGY